MHLCIYRYIMIYIYIEREFRQKSIPKPPRYIIGSKGKLMMLYDTVFSIRLCSGPPAKHTYSAGMRINKNGSKRTNIRIN